MTDKPVLLVVEDDPGLVRQLRWAYEGYEVVVVPDRRTAIDAVRLHEPAVVTLDLGLPPDPDGTAEGFACLAEILAAKPDAKVIVVTGHGARESAVRAIADGAWDYYGKPIDIDRLGLIVARAFHVHALEAENRQLATRGGGDGFGGLVYASPEMAAVTRTLERVAPADVSVMLLGASGTGKELLARGVHDASSRRGGAFVAINCAAIPETLLEAELFGHERGAFTGAIRAVEGKIEQAAGGTLFLDEIGDVPLAVQVKLLRFLQERVIERVGGRKAIPVDTRVVCATHQDVDAMVAAGRFRDDLYYRLAEIVVRIPPLRERSGDAALLARHFIARHAGSPRVGVTGLSAAAAAAIDAHPWPGNVRELENRIKRAVIMAEGKRVTAADLDLGQGRTDDAPLNLRAVREGADRRAIARALARAEGNISAASRLLGISRPTLYDLLKSYGLQG
ncbi:PEP-CTERM-box response regulator transcription factor [uncultured Sphingomonas sp.]|uniref:PEP-CTERM-box response regulator transcription factor n=1 Tax=uncultured Sphingomonas sp. TaxID=158754 RepID=UPI0035C9544A